MKKQTKVVAAFITAIAAAGVFGFAVDRPVLYRFEFLPVANAVWDLVAEKTGDQLQRAKEQVLRQEDWQEKAMEKGQFIKLEDVENLRYWQGRVRELHRKLKKLDK